MQARKSARVACCSLLALVLAVISPASAQWTPPNPVTGVQQQSDGVLFTMKSGSLKIQVCSDSIVHVLYSATSSFPSDVRAQNTSDQFMYGPAFLVNPVTEPGAQTRRLYLPHAKWYDFWSGGTTSGGNDLDAAAPLDRLPLYVRAGSIVPLGPDQEWSTQKAEDPIELRVYRGATADFTLYEDENDNYNYEKGIYATIPIHWDEENHVLTIGDRQGKFPGMLENRTFHVVFVSENHGVGVDPNAKPDKVVQYGGKKVTVSP